jgi:hypothetical protein
MGMQCLNCMMTYIALDSCPGVVEEDHVAVPFSVFWGTSILISIVAVLIYIPISSVCEFFFPPAFLTSCVVCFFNGSLSDWGEMESQCSLTCISLIAKDNEHFFMYLWDICTSFRKCLFNPFAHLFIGLFILLMLNFLRFLHILDIYPLSDYYLANIFSHFLGCLLILLFLLLYRNF